MRDVPTFEAEVIADHLDEIYRNGIYRWQVAHPTYQARTLFRDASLILDSQGDKRRALTRLAKYRESGYPHA